MITLPILPLFLVTALPTDPPPANTDAPPHPHYQKVTRLAGVKGNITVSWFTVPHNQKQVDENRTPGYVWSRGFRLQSDVDLHFGKVKIEKGNYSLGFQLDQEGKHWSIVLGKTTDEMQELRKAMRGARGDRKQMQEIRAKYLAAQAKALIPLPTEAFKGKPAEHLALTGISHGYRCKSRRDPSPISGMEGEIRVSFGDLHVMTKFAEAFAAPKGNDATDGGNQDRRRRRREL